MQQWLCTDLFSEVVDEHGVSGLAVGVSRGQAGGASGVRVHGVEVVSHDQTLVYHHVILLQHRHRAVRVSLQQPPGLLLQVDVDCLIPVVVLTGLVNKVGLRPSPLHPRNDGDSKGFCKRFKTKPVLIEISCVDLSQLKGMRAGSGIMRSQIYAEAFSTGLRLMGSMLQIRICLSIVHRI